MQLKEAVIKGGSRILARQLLGTVIGVAGTGCVAWLIGPGEYGIYAAALAISILLFNTAELGITNYLTRFGPHIPADLEEQASVLLIILGGTSAVILFAAASFDTPWTHGRSTILQLFAIGVAIQLFSIVPLARLERQLAFGLVARAELAGQAALYMVAIPLAWWADSGAWAPATGWLAQQIVICTIYHYYQPIRLAWKWDPEIVRAIATYGIAQTGAEWVFQLRGLISTLVVGTIAGAEAVGVVSLSQRLVEALSFIRNTTKRMAVPVIAQIKDDTPRLVRVLNRATLLQIIGSGVVFLTFVLVGPGIMAPFFGDKWKPVLEVFPLLAAAAVAASIYNLHSAVLYVYARNLSVGAFHVAYISLLLLGVEAFVPRFGAVGYGYAELIALPSSVVVCWFVVRLLRAWPNYGSQGVLALAFALAVVWPTPGCVLGLVLVTALQPQTRVLLSEGFKYLGAVR